jgi:predicted Zn-dependent protease
VHRFRLLPLLWLLLLPAGAALAHPTKQSWLPVSPDHWRNMVAHGGVSLALRDGSTKFIPGPLMETVLKVKDRLEAVSGQVAELALVHTDQPNAYALVHRGRPVVALSLSYLDHVGADEDALAATLSHELAHLHLGHGAEARHASGVMPQTGDDEHDLAAREQERSADSLGMQWAAQAGFDPCGQVRLFRALSAYIPVAATHPGLAERTVAANEAVRRASGRHCE